MKYILLTTTYCPKCPSFKSFVQEKITMEGRIVDETMGDFTDIITEYNATAAPLMIILDSQDREVFRTSETTELEDFLGTL